MLDLKAVAHQFHEDGFVILRQVYMKNEVATLEQRLEEFIRDKVPSLKPGEIYFEAAPSKAIKAIHRMESHSEYFRQLLGDPRLMEILQAIFPQREIIQESAMFFAKMAGAGSETPAHQDNAFQHWRPPDALTLTLAVDESTAANGPLVCFKRSHRLGVLPHRQSGVMGFSRTLSEPVDTETYPQVALCMKPGDVALHHINTIHCSDPNNSSNHRRQIGMAYRSSSAQRDEDAFQRYLKDLENLHNEKATN